MIFLLFTRRFLQSCCQLMLGKNLKKINCYYWGIFQRAGTLWQHSFCGGSQGYGGSFSRVDCIDSDFVITWEIMNKVLVNSWRRFILSLWIELQIALDILKNWGRRGSLLRILLGKLKLLGSKINWVPVLGPLQSAWNWFCFCKQT